MISLAGYGESFLVGMEPWLLMSHRSAGLPSTDALEANLVRDAGVSEASRKTTRQEGPPQADGLWSSVLDDKWECADPPLVDREEPDQWCDEVPLSREGYLDVRGENGKWKHMEEA
eukprot:scaffold26366_cov117-Cylindrotheca_fusiformis.AAC.5